MLLHLYIIQVVIVLSGRRNRRALSSDRLIPQPCLSSLMASAPYSSSYQAGATGRLYLLTASSRKPCRSSLMASAPYSSSYQAGATGRLYLLTASSRSRAVHHSWLLRRIHRLIRPVQQGGSIYCPPHPASRAVHHLWLLAP